MQLIDVLEQRSDNLKLIESVEGASLSCDEDGWKIFIDEGEEYLISDHAIKELLNLIGIPIKYILRCVSSGSHVLAAVNANYWLSQSGEISLLVSTSSGEDIVEQFYLGKRLYIPGERINDLIIEHFNHEIEVHSFIVDRDKMNAIYVTDETISISGEETRDFKLGVKVLFSDCFTTPPRFDGALIDVKTGAVYIYPILGKKLRIANSTAPQVLLQIEDLMRNSLIGLKERFINSLTNLYARKDTIKARSFVRNLVLVLRLSELNQAEILGWFNDPDDLMYISDIIDIISVKTALPTGSLSMESARDIQIGISEFILNGHSK